MVRRIKINQGFEYINSCITEPFKLNSCNIFYTSDESNDALEYFLYHSTKQKMSFLCEGGSRVMSDIMKYDKSDWYPIVLGVIFNNFKLLKTLVQYGGMYSANDIVSSIFNFYIICKLAYILFILTGCFNY